VRIYVASSWRNERQPEVVRQLRAAGHEVYDFRNPAPGNRGFQWEDAYPKRQPWDAEETRLALYHPVARRGFLQDLHALEWCDACVMVQPCGRSSALELGFAVGRGKGGIVILENGCDPELMLSVAHALCLTVDEALSVLQEHREWAHAEEA
jgi:hypothetical protein